VAARKWNRFTHADASYRYEGAALEKNWERLHCGDCEPFPSNQKVREAWRLYHAGSFQEAFELGTSIGVDGCAAASKAAAIYATYLAGDDAAKLEIFQDVARRCEAAREERPQHANSHYLLAYALGRYSQGISVAKALAQGLGGRIKEALERALELQPDHAEAHTAFGAYQAEVINKVGGVVAGLTYGAKKNSALEHYTRAMELAPGSPIAHIEYGNGLLLLFGNQKLAEATRLYEKAAALKPADAMERLDVELAKSELA
jgi:tetratricopeptide (TPR) repeat protein